MEFPLQRLARSRDLDSGATARSADVLLLVLPHWGIVDSWLPVLSELRRRQANLSISVILPTTNKITRLQRQYFLVDWCNHLFDQVITRPFGNNWTYSSNLEEAFRLTDKHQNVIGLEGVAPSGKVVLFDIIMEENQVVRELQDILYDASWFSLPHGIDPRTSKLERKKSTGVRKPKVIVYAASRAEAASYRQFYRLRGEDVKVVGVPRHSITWVNQLYEYYSAAVVPDGDFIFLASRPASQKSFPRERKVQALIDIKRLCEELKCKIVIKLHPLEGDNDRRIFENVFGQSAFGRSWLYASSPSMILGSHALFAITFFSSVAVDMLAVGIPVIERFDFSDLTTPNLARDTQGRLTSIYQQLGLVRGAANFAELREHVGQILANRDSVVDNLKSAYDRIYESSPNAIDLIVRDVLDVLEGTV